MRPIIFVFYRLPLCIWSDVFPVRWQNQNSQESREWCENWIIRERTQMSPIVPRTPNCPCGMSKAENDPGHFHADPYCDKRKTSSKLNCVYNKDAQQCYRRNIQRYVGVITTTWPLQRQKVLCTIVRIKRCGAVITTEE